MRFHLIYCPANGEVYSIMLSPLGIRLSPQCYLATIEKDLTSEQALAKIIEMGPAALWGVKTEDLEEENDPEPWRRDSDWWKE